MSIFDQAPVAAPKAKKTKANSREVVQMEELSVLAAVNALIASLTGIQSEVDSRVKDRALGIFTDKALESKKKPDTFNLEDTGATGQFQLRKRASTSPLTPAEKAILVGFGLPLATNTKVEECFKFKSEVLKDPAIAERISNALMADPVLAEMALIEKQESVKTDIVADTTISTATMSIADKAQLMVVLKIAGVQALKTSFTSPEMQVAFDVLKEAGYDLFTPAEEAAAASA